MCFSNQICSFAKNRCVLSAAMREMNQAMDSFKVKSTKQIHRGERGYACMYVYTFIADTYIYVSNEVTVKMSLVHTIYILYIKFEMFSYIVNIYYIYRIYHRCIKV